jgi:hypothetical protein
VRRLGKNHALCVGSAEASGTLLLFTDADVVFEPATLRRAVTLMWLDGLDYLTAIQDARVPGVALNAFVAALGVFFALYARPWKAQDAHSRHHVGVGAFNLIRAEAYRAIGTHRAIAMRPDDDIKLGKLVKKRGFHQDVVYGRDLIIVDWYASPGELIDGLMKNAFCRRQLQSPGRRRLHRRLVLDVCLALAWGLHDERRHSCAQRFERPAHRPHLLD